MRMNKLLKSCYVTQKRTAEDGGTCDLIIASSWPWPLHHDVRHIVACDKKCSANVAQ